MSYFSVFYKGVFFSTPRTEDAGSRLVKIQRLRAYHAPSVEAAGVTVSGWWFVNDGNLGKMRKTLSLFAWLCVWITDCIPPCCFCLIWPLRSAMHTEDSACPTSRWHSLDWIFINYPELTRLWRTLETICSAECILIMVKSRSGSRGRKGPPQGQTAAHPSSPERTKVQGGCAQQTPRDFAAWQVEMDSWSPDSYPEGPPGLAPSERFPWLMK